jgi:hypothetical protein
MLLSRHAARRYRQRGFTKERMAALLDWADIDRPIGSNCRLIRVSRRVSQRLPGGERLANAAVIVSDHTGEIVTVLSIHQSRSGRRYRAKA